MHEKEENTPENEMENQESNNTEENLDSEQKVESEEVEQEATSEAQDSEDQEVKLAEELQLSKEKYLRMYAEFENFRRRTNKEKGDLIRSANENLIKDLLPVLDDFERARKSMKEVLEVDMEGKEGVHKEVEIMKQGIELIYNNLVKALTKKGLKEMESSIGKPFDLEYHESITQIPAPSEDMKGKIVDEIEKGYFLNDKVIRFAKVVLGS